MGDGVGVLAWVRASNHLQSMPKLLGVRGGVRGPNFQIAKSILSRKQIARQGSVVLFHYNSIGNQFLRSVKKSRMLVFRNMEMSSLNSNIISFPAVADKMEVWITPSSYYVFEFFSLTRPAHSGVSAFASKLNGGTLVAYRSYTKINYHLSLVMRHWVLLSAA
jgi:hypothetical protein